MKTAEQYKKLTISEFTKAAEVYETNHAGIYEMCKDDYPNPQRFFDNVKRALRPGGRLVLQDYTAPAPILWLMNHTEMPLANLIGHGDVGACSLRQIREFCDNCGLSVEKLEAAKKFRMHLVARKQTY